MPLPKNQKRAKLPTLNQEQQIKFLQMIAELKSPVYFEKEFGFGVAGIEYFKTLLKVENQDDARRLLRLKLKETVIQDSAEKIIEERNRIEEANERFVKPTKKKTKKLNQNKINEQDKNRQKRLKKQEDKKSKGNTDWEFIEGTSVELFKNDIINRGFQFCVDKYDVTPQDIKAKAESLNLKIQWDLVPK